MMYKQGCLVKMYKSQTTKNALSWQNNVPTLIVSLCWLIVWTVLITSYINFSLGSMNRLRTCLAHWYKPYLVTTVRTDITTIDLYENGTIFLHTKLAVSIIFNWNEYAGSSFLKVYFARYFRLELYEEQSHTQPHFDTHYWPAKTHSQNDDKWQYILTDDVHLNVLRILSHVSFIHIQIDIIQASQTHCLIIKPHNEVTLYYY